MSELSFDGYVPEKDLPERDCNVPENGSEVKQKPQRVLDTRYLISREQFLSDPRFAGITPFPSKLWLSSPTMHGDEEKYVLNAIRTNWVSTVGENINKVEEECASYIGRKYGVALSSGTAALHIAIRLAGERLYGPQPANRGTLEGKKVFCSDTTFDATVNPVAYEGGEAVFIDSELDSWNMDPVALSRAFELYPDVKLIVLAHLYGTPAKVDEIRKIADVHGALIVEDAAESFGATVYIDSSSPYYKRLGEGWKQTGTFGDYSVISFNGNKVITGSAGGMFLTDSVSDAHKARKWSTQAREDAAWYQHEELGYNYRMSNLIAGVIRGQLGYLEEHISQKRAIYERYREVLRDLPVRMNPYLDGSRPNHWLSCMTIEPAAMCPQVRSEKHALYNTEPGKSCPTEILAAIAAFNAEGRPIWKPMHLQPIYRGNVFITSEGVSRGRSNAYIDEGMTVDNGKYLFKYGLCLPSDNKMSASEQEVVIDIIHRCFE